MVDGTKSPESTQQNIDDQDGAFSPMTSNMKSGYFGASQMLSKSFLTSLNPTNVDQRKKLMKRKIDDLLDQNKQKERRLADLRMELEMSQTSQQREKETLVKLREKVSKKEEALNSPERVYRQSFNEQMMDIKALDHHYNYANPDSVLEKREALLSKIILTE